MFICLGTEAIRAARSRLHVHDDLGGENILEENISSKLLCGHPKSMIFIYFIFLSEKGYKMSLCIVHGLGFQSSFGPG